MPSHWEGISMNDDFLSDNQPGLADQGVIQGALQLSVDAGWQLDRSGLLQEAKSLGMGHLVNRWPK